MRSDHNQSTRSTFHEWAEPGETARAEPNLLVRPRMQLVND
jgi:hypothetical protein